MPDRRFFTTAPPIAIAEALVLAGLDNVAGIEGEIARVAAPAEENLEGAALFAEKPAATTEIGERPFGICFASPAAAKSLKGANGLVIETGNPRAAIAAVANALHQPRGLDDDAFEQAAISSDARVDAHAIIGPGAEIAAGVDVGPYAVIGPGVRIGARTRIGEGASIWCALIGEDCTIAAGARIGAAGFGFAPGRAGLERTPQLGRVLIADRVEIGSNTCIDRGAMGDTVVGARTKIDNLVQIAHNVRIGADCVIAALAGIAGSSIIGDRVMLGGNAGIADHLTIGDEARIAAKGGVISDVPAGETWGGYPARPAREWLKGMAAVARAARQGAKSGGKVKKDGD